MIPRYSLPEMSAIWSEQYTLALWQEVETLVAEAWAELGVVPAEASQAIRERGRADPARVRAREQVTRHDLAAFVDVLGESVGEGGEWVHYGLTSSDVKDTALAVQMREAADLLLRRVEDLFEVVRRRALQHRHTLMLGRTHGVWAEPLTFGLKLAVWAFEIERAYHRLRQARRAVAVGKVSGVVGTYAHLPSRIEELVCQRLGLGVEPASTQVVQRDRHAELLAAMALVGASLEKFATEVRHLQRSELREVEEPFRHGQKGSSAMPHKRNPVASERICGLARLLRGYAQAVLENVALWHERDISHSSVERVAIPDACLALDYALVESAKLFDGLLVDEDRMAANLEAAGGLIFSEPVLLELVKRGMGRDEAYRVVQRNAQRAWDEGRHLEDLLAEDPEVIISHEDLKACFDPRRLLDNSAVVFERLERLELER
ncbi:MAG: adenylosuccinate lyase [Actinomycetota bacterium]|nr:adenylosuccinate lyase [Actinomycetota bacterium]